MATLTPDAFPTNDTLLMLAKARAQSLRGRTTTELEFMQLCGERALARLLQQPMDLSADWYAGQDVSDFRVSIGALSVRVDVVTRLPEPRGATPLVVPGPYRLKPDIWVLALFQDADHVELSGWITLQEVGTRLQGDRAYDRVPGEALHPMDELLEQAGLKPTQSAMFDLGDLPGAGRKWFE